MDYLYNVTESGRSFHERRTAFIILNDKVEFLPKGSRMSHWEFCEEKGINDKTLCFIDLEYADRNGEKYEKNYSYEIQLNNKISKYINVDSMKIYFGQIVPKKDEEWKYDYYYGEFTNGKIIKK